MAIALENSNLVKQKVKSALLNANPAIQDAVNDLMKYMATQGGNPDLQFIPFSAAQITTDGGYSPDVDGNKVYVFYAKNNRTSGTTASFIDLHAATTNGATTTTIAGVRQAITGQEDVLLFPGGKACATELTVAAATAVGGATESSSADAANGFVVIGAA